MKSESSLKASIPCKWHSRYSRIFILILGTALLSPSLKEVQAQLVPEKTLLILNKPSRPSTSVNRGVPEFFDQNIYLRVQVRCGEEATTNVVIQYMIMYEDIGAQARTERKYFTDTQTISLNRLDEKSFNSKVLRLTGRVNRAGSMVGMNYLACGARVYENEKVVYEQFRPDEFQRDLADAVPPLTFKKTADLAPSAPPPNPKRQPQNPFDAPSKNKKMASNAPGSGNSIRGLEVGANGDLDYFGYHFTKEEVTQLLNLANTLTVEQLSDVVGMNRLSAESIVQSRPIHTFEELVSLKRVKKSAIESFKLYLIKLEYKKK